MKKLSLWSLVVLVLLTGSFAKSETKTLFEAYYKIKAAEEHVGYYIQRYQLDTKKREFISIYYLRTNQKGGNISESLKAYSTEKLNPIKYNYTSLQGETAKTIDSHMRKNKKGEPVLQVKVNENGKLRVYEAKLEEGTFFSTFLIYLLLQGEKGISQGAKYKFRAIAEEDGKAFPGEVYVDSETKKMGIDVFKILYTFKRTQFVNFIDSKGESLISVSPALNISAEMTKTREEAVQNIAFNEKNISLLFGNIPEGKINRLVQGANQKSKKTYTPATPKGQ